MKTLRSLLIAPIYNASPITGAGQRTLLLCRALAKLGTVDVLLVSEPACADVERVLDVVAASFAGAGSVAILRSTPQFVAPPAPGFVARLQTYVQRLRHAARSRERAWRPSLEAIASLRRHLERGRYDVIVTRYLASASLSGALAQERVPVVVDLDDLDEAVIASRIGAPTTSVARRWLLQRHAH